jgi:PAS domain S-box-containing protein
VIRVSQAVSSEIVLEKLFDTVMRKAMEHAGAEKGFLIVPRGDELRIGAESTSSRNNVIVRMRDASGVAAPMLESIIPESMLRYVMRTRESVILDDGSSANPFSADPYFLQNRVRSILCLPLLNQSKISGVLYLENNLAPRVFTSDRITVLRVLVSQAAISLENTRLYRDLEDREAKIRRLVDANIIGIATWNIEGALLGSNEAFLRIVQYEYEEVAAGRVRWWDMIPVDWRERAQQALAEAIRTGTVQPFECEFFRKDGSRVPVLTGSTMFQEGGSDGVAFVLDLTQRKRAEDSLRRAQAELSHVTRVTTLGELAASIAHEVNQPLAGIITNADTCLMMLESDPPDVDGVRETLQRTLRDGNRAADVIKRLRALYSKKEFTLESVDLNEATREVIALSLNDFQRNQVILKAEFTEDLPRIKGDRVQLQQVILNLLRNASDAMNRVEDRPRELLIRTEHDEGGQVRLRVKDSGSGFTPEAAAKLFQAFYTTKSEGMGIGLSVSRSIIERHHGRLWAELNDGPGATFSFTIPSGE